MYCFEFDNGVIKGSRYPKEIHVIYTKSLVAVMDTEVDTRIRFSARLTLKVTAKKDIDPSGTI